MEVYLFLGLHNSYFPPDIDFQVLVQVVSSKLLSDKSQWQQTPNLFFSKLYIELIHISNLPQSRPHSVKSIPIPMTLNFFGVGKMIMFAL